MREHRNQAETQSRTGTDRLNRLAAIDLPRLAFFLGVPLVLALYGAMNNHFSAESAGVWVTVAFYLAHAFVPWWLTCLCTRLIFVMLERFRLSAPPIWALGSLLACVLILPYMSWIGVQFPGAQPEQAEAITAGTFFVYAVRAMAVWMLVNWFFERVVGLPRYRYSDAGKSASKTGAPEDKLTSADALDDRPQTIGSRLPKFLRSARNMKAIKDLYSVSAEEHYVRIHTAQGDELVYKRFSDALKELKTLNGMRIHRSHWISSHGFSRIIRDGKRMFVELKDGQRLPVSRPYQELVRSQTKNYGFGMSSASSHPGRAPSAQVTQDRAN